MAQGQDKSGYDPFKHYAENECFRYKIPCTHCYPCEKLSRKREALFKCLTCLNQFCFEHQIDHNKHHGKHIVKSLKDSWVNTAKCNLKEYRNVKPMQLPLSSQYNNSKEGRKNKSATTGSSSGVTRISSVTTCINGQDHDGQFHRQTGQHFEKSTITVTSTHRLSTGVHSFFRQRALEHQYRPSTSKRMGCTTQEQRIPSYTRRNVYIKQAGDSRTCWITGCCQLPNNRIVLVDFNNEKVKLLDESYSCISFYKTPKDPSDVCSTAGFEIAVSVNSDVDALHIVLILKVEDSAFKKMKSIILPRLLESLCFQDGMMFLCSPSQSFVFSYDIKNKILPLNAAIFEEDYDVVLDMTEGSSEETTPKEFYSSSSIEKMAVSKLGSKIYLTNSATHELITLDISTGEVLAKYRSTALREPCGLCVGKDGSVYVQCKSSGTIVQVDSNGKKTLSLIRLEDSGIPYSVAFNDLSNELIVGLYERDYLIVLSKRA